jgi:hypothetical protein
MQSIMMVPLKATQELQNSLKHLTENLHSQSTFIGNKLSNLTHQVENLRKLLQEQRGL